MTRRKHQHVVEVIVNSAGKVQGDFNATAKLVVNLLCRHLVINSASVWLFSRDLSCQHQIASSAISEMTSTFRPEALASCPRYLKQLTSERYIDASDAKSDPRIAEFYLTAFAPRKINSVLDVAIRINGQLEGVICLERQYARGIWQDSDIYLACQAADQLALALATQFSHQQQEVLSLFRSAVEQSEQVTMLVNLQTELIAYVNPAHYQMSGIPRRYISGASIRQLDLFKQYPQLAERSLQQLKHGETIRGEVLLTREDNRQYYLKYHATPFNTELGNHFALIYCEDNTDPHLYQSKLERLAWRCQLTELYNRTHFNQVLHQFNDGFLILIDLIGFKRFNDTYGHRQGDALLTEIARRSRCFAGFPRVNEIARVGSDEFAMLLPWEGELGELERQIINLYRCLTIPLQVGRERFDPRVALAVVNLADLKQDISPLASADIALQRAKTMPAPHIQYFNQQLLTSFYQHAEIERELHLAVRGRQFELHYQPLRDLQTQEYVGAEALIRWHHPIKGMLYPGAFIDIAEQTGMICLIGAWVLEAACNQLKLWQHQQPSFVMHVNVSARQFLGGNLYEQVWQLLSRYRLTPNTLILEITETELMTDIRHAAQLCNELAELGVSLAIDDFGTGYSSMRYLKQFPISKLKIDRSFIADLSVSRESREIVSAIIAMAKALNISLTAEGVETPEQESFLAACQCHQAQGFLYSQALRGPDFCDFMAIEPAKSLQTGMCSAC